MSDHGKITLHPPLPFVGRAGCEKCHGHGLAITQKGIVASGDAFTITFSAGRCDCIEIVVRVPASDGERTP